MSTNKITGVALATLAAGFLATAPAFADTPTGDTGNMVQCMGANSCKGKGSCKSMNNACKGQNSCKGKGIMSLSKADCDKMGGKVMDSGTSTPAPAPAPASSSADSAPVQSSENTPPTSEE